MPAPQVQLTVQSSRIVGLRAQQVIDCMFSHPEWNQLQIGKQLGITGGRVGKILKSKRCLDALPHVARQRIKRLIPKATQRYHQLLKQNVNLEVARKVSTSVLESEKVLEAAPTMQINVLAALTDEELREKINRSSVLPTRSIEGELV